MPAVLQLTSSSPRLTAWRENSTSKDSAITAWMPPARMIDADWSYTGVHP